MPGLLWRRYPRSNPYLLILGKGYPSTTQRGGNPYFTNEFFGLLFSSLTDDFNDNSQDLLKWSKTEAGSATLLEQNTRVEISLPAASTATTQAFYRSKERYSLVRSSVAIQVITAPSAATAANAEFRLEINNGISANYLRFVYEAGTLYAQRRTAGGSIVTLGSAAFNASTHAWWRIREASGQIFYEVSSDGTTYSNFVSPINTPIDVNALNAYIGGSCYQVEVNPGQFIFDNFNTVSVATQNITGVGFTDSDSFGVGTLATVIALTGTGFTDADSFGVGALATSLAITGTAYSDPDLFGAGIVTRAITITGIGFSDADSFGSGVIAASLIITGASYSDPDLFGAGAIATAIAITGAGFADIDSFGGGVITQSGGLQSISGTGFADGDSFGAGTITGLVAISGIAIVDPDSFGSGSLTTAIAINGTGFSDNDFFGSGIIASLVSITGTGISDPDAFGAGSLTLGGIGILGTGFTDADSFGAGLVTAGTLTLGGSGFTDTDQFGAGVLSTAIGITGTGVNNNSQFGAGVLDLRIILIASGFVDSDNFGSGVVTKAIQQIYGAGFINNNGSGGLSSGLYVTPEGQVVMVDQVAGQLVEIV